MFSTCFANCLPKIKRNVSLYKQKRSESGHLQNIPLKKSNPMWKITNTWLQHPFLHNIYIFKTHSTKALLIPESLQFQVLQCEHLLLECAKSFCLPGSSMMLLKDLMSELSHWLLDRNTGLLRELVPVLKIAKSRLLTLLGVQPVFLGWKHLGSVSSMLTTIHSNYHNEHWLAV